MRATRLARALWMAWAIVVWNVVFDHTIVVAGRNYIVAADRAASSASHPNENMDAWMRPAISHGLWIATAAGMLILVPGLALTRAGRRSSQVGSCA